MSSLERKLKRSIILIDKPSGPSCRAVDDKIKAILGRKKIGHSGTLDSKVTGLLVIALDEATKAMPFLVRSDKTYEGVIYLHKDVEISKLRDFINNNFIGEITQVPPVRSSVARKPRKRIIHTFEILKKDGNDLFFKTEVEAGTYIRKLIHDIGEKFGVGMHMKSLRRLKAGEFSIEQAITLDQLEEAYRSYKRGDETPLEEALIPIENTLKKERKVVLKENFVKKVQQGSPVYWNYIRRMDKGTKKGDRLVFYLDNKIIGFGTARMNYKKMKNKRVSVIKTDRILLD